MLELVLALMTSSMSFQFFEQAFEWKSPHKFDPKVREVHIPQGFDFDDVAQIIAVVEFQNVCEKLGPVSVFPHDEFRNVLLLSVEGYRRRSELPERECENTFNAVPVTIDIGVLEPNVYEIRNYKNLDQSFGQLRIRAQKDGRIDDLTFAPVDSLVVHEDSDGHRRLFSLAGKFSNNCTFFDLDRFKIARTAPRMIEVLPAVKTIDGENCLEGNFPFVETFEIPQRDGRHRIGSGPYLFHVRTMNGRSFSKLDVISLPY